MYLISTWRIIFEILPEVFLGDVGAVPELAEVADPYVALEAHQDGAVDGAHHGNLQTPNSAISCQGRV